MTSPLPQDPIALARQQWESAGWVEPARGMAVVTSITRTHQILLARMDNALQPFDISFARFEVLGLLSFSRHGRLPLGRLSQRLQVAAASITKAVKRLEAQGLVRRIQDAVDGRNYWAEITPEGRDVIQRATEHIISAVLADLGLTIDEMEYLFDILAKIRRYHGDFAASPDDQMNHPARPETKQESG